MRQALSFLIACLCAGAAERDKDATAWNEAGLINQIHGRYKEAERNYLRAIQMVENNPDGWEIRIAATHNLATLFLEHGSRFSQAERLLRDALAAGAARWTADAPELAILLANLGAALMEQGRNSEAAEYFQKALPNMQGDQAAALQSNLGVLAYRQHNLLDAVSYFSKSIAAYGGRPEALHPLLNLGGVYLKLGRNADAAECFGKAVQAAEALGPDNTLMGPALRSYALALRKIGRKDESRKVNERSKAFTARPDATVDVSELIR